jgi:hypothetical protein
VSRAVSATALAAMMAESTDQVFLTCVTLDHDDLGTPIRLVDNDANIVRTAGTFTAYPFKITLPADLEDRLPFVTLSFDNIDRSLIATVRDLDSPPTATVEIILADSPNTVEAGPFEFRARSVSYNALTIQLELAYEYDVLNERFPGPIFDPTRFAGLF